MLLCVSVGVLGLPYKEKCCDNVRHIFIIYTLYETAIQSSIETEQKSAEIISCQNADNLQLILVIFKYP